MDKELFVDLLASVKEMQNVRAGKRKPGRVAVIEPKQARARAMPSPLRPKGAT